MDKSETGDPNEPFHERVREQMRSIPVPPGLRRRILAQSRKRKVLRPEFLPPAIAIAASLLLLASLFFLSNTQPEEDTSFAGFQNRMTAFAVRQYRMDILTKDLAEVRKYLAARRAPTDFQLTSGLLTTPVKGAAMLSWQGKPVSMVCFDGPRSRTIYLFIIDSATFEAVPETAVLESLKGLASAFWSRAGKTYLLAADLSEVELKACL